MSVPLEVGHTTVSRWLDNETLPTSMENCLRIAKACGVAPQDVFELVGKPEFAELLGHYQMTTPTIGQVYGNPACKDLAERFDVLLRLGWQDRLEDEIGKLEAYWRFAREPFQRLAEQCGAEAAFLVMSCDDHGQVILYVHRITPNEAQRILDETPQGWQRRSHTDKKVNLTLCLQTSKKLADDAIELHLRGWAGTVQTLLS